MSPLFGSPTLAALASTDASAAGAVPFLAGLLLGLSMILPIGPQNLFVLTQGLTGGTARGLLAAVTAGVCDTVLILTGAAGLSALLTAVPWLQAVLLGLGAVFLVHLGVASWRVSAPTTSTTGNVGGASGSGEAAAAGDGGQADAGGNAVGGRSPALGLALKAIGVSWGNPHAILDTVAVLGSAIAARPAASRTMFAAGTVAASWLFFLFLALAGALFRSRVTPRTEVWIARASGALMLLFAIILGREAVVAAAGLAGPFMR